MQSQKLKGNISASPISVFKGIETVQVDSIMSQEISWKSITKSV